MYPPYCQSVTYLTIILIGFNLFSSCSSSRLRKLDNILEHEVLENSFHGLVILDAKSGKSLFNTNGNRYFTPASNTKIATLYAGLKLIPEYFPTLKYAIKNDSIFVIPTGDPTWLHPYFKDSTGINFLKTKNHISIYLGGSAEERFGPGWAWEDYDTYFSPEKSELPLYGNVITISNNNGLQVSPQYFLDSIVMADGYKRRDESKNKFYINPLGQDTIEVPFMVGKDLTKKLLESALKKELKLMDTLPSGTREVLYGIKSDSIFKRMMHLSDNFLAEQVLMTASSTLSDTLSTKKTITYILENELTFLEQQPRWVDGSGLSRYNLFTPKSFVQILQKLYGEIDQERLFTLFPMWAATGTVSKWKQTDTEPFIFAKSGSLGNNYNLSGYVKTKSGKLLIFSFMNNHFRQPNGQIRMKIYNTLKKIYEDH